MKTKILIILCFFILMGKAHSQDEIITNPYRGYVSIGGNITTWKIGEGWANTITQLTVSIQAVFPVGSHFHFAIVHSPAITWGYVEEERITGLSDTWIKGNYVFWNNRAVLNVGLGLPTGKTRLDENQYKISKDNLIRNVFQYPLPVYGQGFSGRIGLLTAHPVRDGLVVGIGLQYHLRSAYHPVNYEYSYDAPAGPEVKTWDVAYRPGDELAANIGVDIKIKDNMKIMLDGIYTHYWRDLLDGREIYGSGNKLNLNIGFYWEFDRQYLYSHFLYRRRGKNELLQGLSIQQEQQPVSGDQYEFNMIWQAMRFPNGAFGFTGETRYYPKNELNTGPDMVIGLGIKTFYRFGLKTKIDFNFKVVFGKIRFEEVRSITGLVSSLGIKYDL